MATQNCISHCLTSMPRMQRQHRNEKASVIHRERENKKARNINLPTQRKLKQARGAHWRRGGRNILQKTT